VIKEECSVAKLHCLVASNSHERYGDVDHQIKKARVQGMCSSAKKIAVELIIDQINVTWENKEFYKSIYGNEKYKSFIASLVCQLLGQKLSSSEGAACGLTQSTTGVEDLTKNPSYDDDDDMDMNSQDYSYFLSCFQEWAGPMRKVG
jgi:hypothetical protein